MEIPSNKIFHIYRGQRGWYNERYGAISIFFEVVTGGGDSRIWDVSFLTPTARADHTLTKRDGSLHSFSGLRNVYFRLTSGIISIENLGGISELSHTFSPLSAFESILAVHVRRPYNLTKANYQ